ncbi:MAG: hypothetical protein NZM12_05815, partial [Steroidobacteraceae bacterium]|nr:hypothetical protein [Steroidobacteraceae bacterium]MDW8259944.1 hypothetical protein [Gammaproteobacteria bacterium]
GALAAQRRGEAALARDRFERLLAFDPPPELRAAIEEQIRALEAELPADWPRAPAAGAGDDRAAPTAARVEVEVSLGLSVPAATLATAPLFVLARRPGEAGPPLAVKRLPAQLPARVVLTESDAMLPDRKLRSGEVVEVVARISLSGAPQAATGDPFGSVRYHVGKDRRVGLRIDRVAP